VLSDTLGEIPGVLSRDRGYFFLTGEALGVDRR
jgi:hypothetical protein